MKLLFWIRFINPVKYTACAAKKHECKNTDDLYVKTIHVPISIETDEDGVFIVSCPQFKGCHTFGKTIDEALTRIKEVIELCREESQPEYFNTLVGFREVKIV